MTQYKPLDCKSEYKIGYHKIYIYHPKRSIAAWLIELEMYMTEFERKTPDFFPPQRRWP